jgi:hypothetical protein
MSDTRSALVLVEPVFAPGRVLWHGMAFAGGEVVNDITGMDRAVVLDDCWCALDGAGISTEPPSLEELERADTKAAGIDGPSNA